MARFPSIDETGAFEAPEVQNSIKELVTGSTDGITVDTSVGRKVSVGGQPIFYDSGWRNITHLAQGGRGLDTTYDNGRLEVRRTLDEVFFFIRLRISDDYDGLLMSSRIRILDDLPAAFRQTPTIYGTLATSFVGGVPIYFENGTSLTHLNVMGHTDHQWVGGRTISVAFSYPTKAALPTSLPGTPA